MNSKKKQKKRVTPGAPEGYACPAPHAAPVVYLMPGYTTVI